MAPLPPVAAATPLSYFSSSEFTFRRYSGFIPLRQRTDVRKELHIRVVRSLHNARFCQPPIYPIRDDRRLSEDARLTIRRPPSSLSVAVWGDAVNPDRRTYNASQSNSSIIGCVTDLCVSGVHNKHNSFSPSLFFLQHCFSHHVPPLSHRTAPAFPHQFRTLFRERRPPT